MDRVTTISPLDNGIKPDDTTALADPERADTQPLDKTRSHSAMMKPAIHLDAFVTDSPQKRRKGRLESPVCGAFVRDSPQKRGKGRLESPVCGAVVRDSPQKRGKGRLESHICDDGGSVNVFGESGLANYRDSPTDETTVLIYSRLYEKQPSSQPPHHTTLQLASIKPADLADAVAKDPLEKLGKRRLESKVCDDGGPVNVPAKRDHVWCWDRQAGETGDSTKRVQEPVVAQPISQNLAGTPGDADTWRGNNQWCQQRPVSYQMDRMLFNVLVQQTNQHLLDASWLVTLPIRFESSLLDTGSALDWVRENRKVAMFYLVCVAEFLWSQNFTRADVKYFFRSLLLSFEEVVLSTTPTSYWDHFATYICEILTESSEDILNSAEELHRIYQTEAVVGPDTREEWVYHYGYHAADIWSTRELRPNSQGGHIKFGRGVYFTELVAPNDLEDLRVNNYDGNLKMGTKKVMLYIKVPKKSIEQQLERCTDRKRPHRNIWILPTEEEFPLPRGSRIGVTGMDQVLKYLEWQIRTSGKGAPTAEQTEGISQHNSGLTNDAVEFILFIFVLCALSILGGMFAKILWSLFILFICGTASSFAFDLMMMVMKGTPWLPPRQQSFVLGTLMPCLIAVSVGVCFVGVRVSLGVFLQMLVLGKLLMTTGSSTVRRHAMLLIALCVIAYMVGILIFMEVLLIARAIGAWSRLVCKFLVILGIKQDIVGKFGDVDKVVGDVNGHVGQLAGDINRQVNQLVGDTNSHADEFVGYIACAVITLLAGFDNFRGVVLEILILRDLLIR